MKLAILHCGHGKTGSTALQSYLFSNSDALIQSGILYPKITKPDGSDALVPWAKFQHGGIFKQIIAGRGQSEGKSELGQFLKIIKSTEHDILLLSAEYLFKNLFFRDQHRIHEFLNSLGYKIHTISYLRDQADWLGSSYAQTAQAAGTCEPFDAFCRKRAGIEPPTDQKVYNKLLVRGMLFDRLAVSELHFWGQHTFRPFNQHVKAVGIANDFISALRDIFISYFNDPLLTPDVVEKFFPIERLNESVGIIRVALGRALAKTIQNRFPQHWQNGQLRIGAYVAAGNAISTLKIEDPKFAVLTPKRLINLRSIFQNTNEVFAQKVWGGSWEDIFPTPDVSRLKSNDLYDTMDTELTKKFQEAFKIARKEMVRNISIIDKISVTSMPPKRRTAQM